MNLKYGSCQWPADQLNKKPDPVWLTWTNRIHLKITQKNDAISFMNLPKKVMENVNVIFVIVEFDNLSPHYLFFNIT